MLFDTLMMVLDAVDHAGTLNGEVDLNDAKGAQTPLTFVLKGSEDAAGAVVAASTDITLTITSRTTSGSGTNAIATIVATAAEVNNGVYFTIPSHCARYCYMAITGTISAGKFTLAQVMGSDKNFYTIA